jgi:hypothetical protein
VVDSFINMLDGSKKPFDALLHYAEQTFAKIAAEALLNPIIVPIITQAVNGVASYGAGALAAGASGASGGGLGAGQLALTGALGAQFAGAINTFGASYLGTGATAGSLAAAAPNSVSLASLNAPMLTSYMGGAAVGGLLGYGLTSLTGGNKTVGSIGGSLAGAAFMIPGIGPELAAAIAAITMIGSAFGPRPSDKTEGYTFDPTGTYSMQVGNAPGSKKFSQQNLSDAANFQSAIKNFTTGIAHATGGSYTGGNIGFDTGNQDGSHVYFYGAGGGGQTSFSSPQDAIAYTMQRITTLFTGLGPDVETAFKSIDWTGDLQTNLSLVQFAASFQDNIKAMEAGTLDIQKDAYTAAATQVQGYIAQIRQFKDTTAQLGLSTDKADEATRSFVENLVGLKDTTGPQSALGQAIETLKGTFAAIGPLLKEVGLDTVDTTALLQQAVANLGAPIVQDLQSRIFASQGRGYVNQTNSALWQYGTDVSNLSLLGMSPDLAGQALHGALQTIFAGLNAGQLRDIMVTFKAFPDVVADANKALEDLNTSITATLSVAVPNAAQAGGAGPGERGQPADHGRDVAADVLPQRPKLR